MHTCVIAFVHSHIGSVAMIFPIGPTVNALAIIIGAFIGMSVGSKLSDKMRQTIFQCLGISVLIIGFQMAMQTNEILILIFSLLIGGVVGEALDLEQKFLKFGDKVKAKVKTKDPRFTEGFVSASVLFCIGAMAIISSLDEGLRNDTSVAFSKSILDGFASIAMGSVFGLGVVFSAFSVFIYQASIVLCAQFLAPYISEALVTELSALGGAIIIGIGLNLLELTQIRLSNLLPSLILTIIFTLLFI